MNFLSRLTHNIKRFLIIFYSWANPLMLGNARKLAIKAPLLPNPKKTSDSPTPTPINHELIAQAKDALLERLPVDIFCKLFSTHSKLRDTCNASGIPSILATSKLTRHVLWNKPSAVKELLEDAKSNSQELVSLLTNPVRLPVECPSGLFFKDYTPFQAALCTWNTDLCQLLKAYFAQIPDGPEKIRTQINKIFPKGVEAFIKVQENKAAAFKEETLRPLITTLSAASDTEVKILLENKRADSNLGKAIARFREKFKEASNTDPVFNPYYLQEAYNLFVECLCRSNEWDKRNLFCVQVIGGVQCYSSAYDLQAFAQGTL